MDIAGRELGAALAGEHRRHEVEHLAVGAVALGLHPGLDLVVAGEQRIGIALAEQPRQRAADPAIPVDQRPVAVEGGEAVGVHARASVYRPEASRATQPSTSSRDSRAAIRPGPPTPETASV